MTTESQGIFDRDTYTITRALFNFLGGKFRGFDDRGVQVFFVRQKAFKLKEDIRVFADETETSAILSIQARSIIDFSAAYDIVDSSTGVSVGAMKRKGWKSILKDEWIFMDPAGLDIGRIKEDNMALAFIRRFGPWVGWLIPQSFYADVNGERVCTYKQGFNPFARKLTIRFEPGSAAVLDRRLGLGAAILLSAIESRQGAG